VCRLIVTYRLLPDEILLLSFPIKFFGNPIDADFVFQPAGWGKKRVTGRCPGRRTSDETRPGVGLF
jgi:hypothetical protein